MKKETIASPSMPLNSQEAASFLAMALHGMNRTCGSEATRAQVNEFLNAFVERRPQALPRTVSAPVAMSQEETPKSPLMATLSTPSAPCIPSYRGRWADLDSDGEET